MSEKACQAARAASGRAAKPTGQERQQARLDAALGELARFCHALGEGFSVGVSDWSVSLRYRPSYCDLDHYQTLAEERRPARGGWFGGEAKKRLSAATAAEKLLRRLKRGGVWLEWYVLETTDEQFGSREVKVTRSFRVPSFSSAAEFELMMAARGVDLSEGMSLPAI